MNDTPETDEALSTAECESEDAAHVAALTAVTEQLDSYKERYTKLAGKYAVEIHELTEQRDRLAESLKDHMSALGLALKDYMFAFEQRDRLALKDYLSAFGQGLEAHGIPMGEQQVEADANARKAIQSLTPNEL